MKDNKFTGNLTCTFIFVFFLFAILSILGDLKNLSYVISIGYLPVVFTALCGEVLVYIIDSKKEQSIAQNDTRQHKTAHLQGNSTAQDDNGVFK